ncbi:unnamed protein product, partial [Mesorhabditis belari]|uniref:Uncharacterized protein n=1 Tax=Mesorhabditis belari TaxID=2138241 RepID=A0AAF3J6R0_9BILA
MIGIMNCGDDSVEFYASARQSSLYRHPPIKQKRTYTADGRVFIDGIPLTTEPPAEQKWHDLISKIMAMRLMKIDSMEQQGPMAAIRRLSTKLKLTKTLSNSSTDEAILMTDLHDQVRDRKGHGARRNYTDMKSHSRHPVNRNRAISAPPRRKSESSADDGNHFVTRIDIEPGVSRPHIQHDVHVGTWQHSLLNAVFAEGDEREERDSGRDSMRSDSPPITQAHLRTLKKPLGQSYSLVDRC